MSEDERQLWEDRYRTGAYEPRRDPSKLLVRAIDTLPRGRALDVACGTGRNAIFLARHAFDVEGVDVSQEALRIAEREASSQGLDVTWLQADLDNPQLEREAYQVIVVCFYVNRGLVPALKDALAPNGTIVVEQHLRTAKATLGPRNPEWRFGPNELLRAFSDLRILYYEETIEPEDERRPGVIGVARLIASKDPDSL